MKSTLAIAFIDYFKYSEEVATLEIRVEEQFGFVLWVDAVLRKLLFFEVELFSEEVRDGNRRF